MSRPRESFASTWKAVTPDDRIIYSNTNYFDISKVVITCERMFACDKLVITGTKINTLV